MRRLWGLVSARPLALHPLLFASFPLLFLVARNLREDVPLRSVLVPLAWALVVTALLQVLATLMFGSAQRAAIVVSTWVMLFLSYGHFWNAVQGRRIGPLEIESQVYLLIPAAVVGMAVVALAIRVKGRLTGTTKILNVVAAFLVLINVVGIGIDEFTGGQTKLRAETVEGAARFPANPRPTLSAAKTPDIYYIVMDRYAGAQTLEESFGFNNSEFLTYLRGEGFYAASESRANYRGSAQSLASSLNMVHLNALAEQLGRGSDDWGPVYRLLKEFEVARYLKSLGYRYVHLGSWWEPTRTNAFADLDYQSESLSEFSQILSETTLLPVIDPDLDPRQRKYELALWQFEKLRETVDLPGPIFVFAHIILPHPPYVFDVKGGYVTQEREESRALQDNYVRQLRFTNSKLQELLDSLLSGPDGSDPVIILQADEGPRDDRESIVSPCGEVADWTEATPAQLNCAYRVLNAYYLPGVGYSDLYPEITPVNSFRLVFNLYFSANLPLLPDRSYTHPDRRRLYDFIDVTERLRG